MARSHPNEIALRPTPEKYFGSKFQVAPIATISDSNLLLPIVLLLLAGSAGSWLGGKTIFSFWLRFGLGTTWERA